MQFFDSDGEENDPFKMQRVCRKEFPMKSLLKQTL